MPMTMKGRVVLAKTHGRQEPWVFKKVDHDYFLSLHITEINGRNIITTEDAFEVLKVMFPDIRTQNKNLNDLFGNITLPKGADDVLHLTLGNFPDFRYNRDVTYDVDFHKVEEAEDLAGTEVTLELSEKDFELVGTSENLNKVTLSSGAVQHAPSVGMNRDGVLNLKPSKETQAILAALSKSVFGEDFKLWDSRKNPIPYHIAIAQTNALSKALDTPKADEEQELSRPAAFI